MNKWFNPRSFVDLIERYNPFGFKKEDDDTCLFKNYTECYLYTLKKLYLQFPRGYIDMALFVEKRTHLPYNDSLRVVKGWKTMGIDEVMLIDFTSDDISTRYQLASIMKALHTISETRFNEALFYEAYALFKNWQEVVKDKELLDYVEENG